MKPKALGNCLDTLTFGVVFMVKYYYESNYKKKVIVLAALQIAFLRLRS